jgi:glucose/mannose-6-phosphate isomerase
VSSYSGNTEETLSAYSEALERGARVVCSTTGGELGRMAAARGVDVVTLPTGYPPRAALAFGLLPMLVILARLGLAPELDADISDAISNAREGVRRFGPESVSSSNQAKQLAEWLFGKTPVVYGTAPITSVVAARWCGQMAENSKVIAHWNVLPEMNHNEIVGLSGKMPLSNSARIVFLRDEDDHPRVMRRIEITRDAVTELGIGVREAQSFGRSALARMLSLVQLGDYVSFYLAVMGGVDPTPVRPIDKLKRALADS